MSPPVTITSEMIAVHAADTPPSLDDINRQLLNFIEVFELNGSRWVSSNYQILQLTLWQLDPLRGNAFIPLPRWIQARKAVVNGAGTCDECFKWAILADMHPVDVNADSRGKYVEHIGKYEFSSLSFLVPLQTVGSFALRNNMSIKVYGVDDDEVIYHIRLSFTLVPDRHGVQHYTAIRNFSRVDGRQLRCRFANIQKQLLAPFVLYADFESILQRVGDEAMDTTQGVAVGSDDEPTPEAGPFQEHLPCSFAYKLVSSVVTDFSRPLVSYRGEDAGEMFVRKLQEEAEQLFPLPNNC